VKLTDVLMCNMYVCVLYSGGVELGGKPAVLWAFRYETSDVVSADAGP